VSESATVWFLRSGRKRRARGIVVETANGLTKIRPTAKRWRHLWVTPQEIAAAGRTKAEIAPPKTTGSPVKEALESLEEIDTIRLAVAGFHKEATAISKARVALDQAQNDPAQARRPADGNQTDG